MSPLDSDHHHHHRSPPRTAMMRMDDSAEPLGDLRRLVLQRPTGRPSSPVPVPLRETAAAAVSALDPGSPCSTASSLSPLSPVSAPSASSLPGSAYPRLGVGKTIHRVRSHGRLSVNRPSSKSDFADPQKCLNGRFGRMRRNWTFLDLQSCTAAARKQELLDEVSAASSNALSSQLHKSLSLCTLESLADLEDRPLKQNSRTDFHNPIFMDQG